MKELDSLLLIARYLICSTPNISLDAFFNMTVNVTMLGLCLRVAGMKWGMVLPGVPLEDVQDIAPWGLDMMISAAVKP